MEQRQCICCRTRFTPLRNPDQRYCSKSACQKKRQCRYKRQKLNHDADYKQNQHDAQKRWCKNHPDYWRQYRVRKPKYTESNRIAQRIRNKNRHCHQAPAGHSEVIAKITPLIPETQYLLISYQLLLLSFDVIAKRVRYRQENNDLLMSPI